MLVRAPYFPLPATSCVQQQRTYPSIYIFNTDLLSTNNASKQLFQSLATRSPNMLAYCHQLENNYLKHEDPEHEHIETSCTLDNCAQCGCTEELTDHCRHCYHCQTCSSAVWFGCRVCPHSPVPSVYRSWFKNKVLAAKSGKPGGGTEKTGDGQEKEDRLTEQERRHAARGPSPESPDFSYALVDDRIQQLRPPSLDLSD